MFPSSISSMKNNGPFEAWGDPLPEINMCAFYIEAKTKTHRSLFRIWLLYKVQFFDRSKIFFFDEKKIDNFKKDLGGC